MRTSCSKLILIYRFICAAAWHEIRIQALHDDSPFKKVEEAWHDHFTSYTLPSNGTTYQVIKTWAPSRYMNTRCRDDGLETDVHSANGGMNPTDRQEILPRAPGWYCLNYHTISRQFLQSSRTTAAIVASSLAAVRSVRDDLHSQLQYVLHITSRGDAVTVINT